jgi:hypothetical protein
MFSLSHEQQQQQQEVSNKRVFLVFLLRCIEKLLKYLELKLFLPSIIEF